MSVVRVAVIGHSQVPNNFASYNDVEVKIFRKSDALLTNIYFSPLVHAFSWPHDITILFLGGNDIFSSTPKQVVDQILDIGQQFHTVSKKVYVICIEPRNYPKNSPFAPNNREYRRKAKSVNRRLVSLANANNNFMTINFTPHIYQLGTHYGVHFGAIAHGLMITKFKIVIAHARAALNI